MLTLERNANRLWVPLLCFLFIGSATTSRADDGRLDHDSLKSMLEDLGYEVTVKRFNTTGNPFYEVAVKRPDRTCRATVQLSPDQSIVWLTATFSKIPDDRAVPPQILRKMLEINFDSTYMRFAINPKSGMLQLEHSFDNENLTPAVMRAAIERACDMIVKHVEVWSIKRWPTADDDGKLDHDSLKTLLENLGYEFTVKKFESNGIPYYTVEEKGCYVILQLSPNKSTLWITADFSTMPEGREVPPQILRKMLEINYDSQYMRFAINPKSRTLRLEDSFDNVNLKPVVIRRAIDRACDVILRHADVWDMNKWPAADSPRSTPSKAKDSAKEKVEGAAEASKEAE